MAGHWGALGVSVAAALVSSAAMATVPLLLGDAVNEGLVGRHWARFGLYAALIAGLGCVQAVASGARRWWNGLASRQVESEMRREFHDHLLYLDVGYHSNVNRGQLLSRVTSDLFQVQAVVASAPFWVGNAALALAVAGILLATNLQLAGVALVALPLVALTSKRFSGRVREAIADLQRRRGSLAGVVEETVSGVRAVKGFGVEALMEDRLAGAAGDVLDEAMRVVRTRARYLPVLNTVPMLELAIVNWFGAYLVLRHHLTVGMLVAFNAYLASLTGPLQSIGAYVVMLQRAVVSGDRLARIISRRSEVPEPAQPVDLPRGPGSVVFEDVSFAYRAGGADRGTSVPVLEHFDLRLAGGELVAIVGPTGAGKTTLLSLLARLAAPDRGRVLLDGADLADLALATVRGAVGVVFEDSFLFNDTIAANLRVGRPEASERELWWALRLAQADDFVRELPQGTSTPVGERGLALSGGQRQRLALARALLAEPRVLVLDDATSAVDAPREVEVVRGLAAARAGRTTVVISHRAATVAVADRALLLAGGRVVAEGTHSSLLATSPEYRHVLGLDGPVPAEEAEGEPSLGVSLR